MKRYFFLFLPLFVFLFAACSEDDTSTSEKILFVNSQTKLGYDTSNSVERPFLQVKFNEADTVWTSIYGISKFEYEGGYFYKLKVLEKRNSKPKVDQVAITYELIEILSKSEDI